MKTLIAFILLFSFSAHAQVEDDKLKHVAASSTLSTGFYLVYKDAGLTKFQSYVTAVASTLAIGYLKESTDKFYDKKDMQANAVGAAFPILIVPF